MGISAIKKNAREIFAENRKKYVIITSIYFVVTLALTTVFFILNAILDTNSSTPFWGEHANNLYVTYFSLLIIEIMSAFFLIWIYSVKFKHSNLEIKDGYSKGKAIKYILSKSILLGFVLFITTAPFKIINDILEKHDNGSADLLAIILLLTSAIISFILDFTIIIYFLEPQNSIWSSMKKSVNIITKYIGTYITFGLSFILWTILPGIVYFAGIVLYFNGKQSTNFEMQLFTIFCIQIMVGFGIYFYPYFNIAKFKLCEALLAEVEKTETESADKSLPNDQIPDSERTAKKHLTNKTYILKSPITEVIKGKASEDRNGDEGSEYQGDEEGTKYQSDEERTENQVAENRTNESKIDTKFPMNKMNIAVPYSYAMKLVDLNWNDVLFAIEHGYFSCEEAVECAKNEISKNRDAFYGVFDLAGLTPSIKNYEDVVHEYVIEFSNRVPKKEKRDSQDKIMYVLLSWVFDHKDEYEDPLLLIETIYEDFNSPVEISEFTRKIPDIEDESVTFEQEMEIFYENWSKYLREQKTRFMTIG